MLSFIVLYKDLQAVSKEKALLPSNPLDILLQILFGRLYIEHGCGRKQKCATGILRALAEKVLVNCFSYFRKGIVAEIDGSV